MNQFISKKLNKEDGQGLVEYALVLVLVAVVVILILTVLGSQVTFVYAQVLAGLNGDSLDDNAIMLSSESSSSKSGNECQTTLENINFIVTDSNGNVLTDQSVTATVRANGTAVTNITGTANASGVANVAGPVTAVGSCPLKITLSAN